MVLFVETVYICTCRRYRCLRIDGYRSLGAFLQGPWSILAPVASVAARSAPSVAVAAAAPDDNCCSSTCCYHWRCPCFRSCRCPFSCCCGCHSDGAAPMMWQPLTVSCSLSSAAAAAPAAVSFGKENCEVREQEKSFYFLQSA